VNLVEALATGVGPRTAGSTAAGQAADTVAEAFRELGLEPRFQEFNLVGYEADEPELDVEGERWAAGPCMYAHSFDGEGTVRRIGESTAPIGGGKLPSFALFDQDGNDVARLLTSPFGRGAIPFMSSHTQITTPPTAFVSVADAERLQDGMRVRLKVGGTFVPGRRERNVIADLPAADGRYAIVSAHYDSVYRGPGAIDNASGVEGMRRVAERFVGQREGVRFVAFAAEEIKLTGSRLYVDEAKLRGELDEIVGVVNLDCIARGDHLNILASPETLADRAIEAARVLGLIERYDLITGPATGGVDSHWFVDAGIPALTLAHFPYEEYHLPDDVPTLADERLIDDTVALAAALVDSQLAHPVTQ
jgi:peptidase M28-like protein